jgi:hypothetical protein
VSRPSELQVSLALDVLNAACRALPEQERALKVLRRALKPRPVWPAKEAAACLGVDPSNLGDLRGMPAPAQKLARPAAGLPNKTMSLWFVDEIEEFAARRRAERGGT